MPCVRISKGSFKPEDHDEVRDRLDRAQASLVPAIRKLEGLLHYHAGIDRASSTMVNVSIWRSLSDAQQMDALPEMQALAREFIAAGVAFDRPIVNYDVLWHIG